MSMTVEQIYAEALRLPDKSKVFLAEQLVEYLGSHIDHDIEDMHLETVKRRRDEVRFGKVQPVDGEAALAHVPNSPFGSIIPRDSKKTDIIQIADIILGAIGFQKNGYDLLSGSKPSKKELCEYIAQKAGLKNLVENTPFHNERFTIWNFQLKK
jgi:hypothetical protein